MMSFFFEPAGAAAEAARAAGLERELRALLAAYEREQAASERKAAQLTAIARQWGGAGE